MKKIFFALMACVALFGLSACSDSVESQIFDLTYDKADFESGDVMFYQNEIQPVFAAELAKVAKQPTETGYTYMINGTENKAKADIKAAFEKASVTAQERTVTLSHKPTGFRAVINYSNVSSQKQPVEWISYTFK